MAILNIKRKKAYSPQTLKNSFGFTLIELVVVLSIFVIVSSVILADYPAFSQRVALERTAQEVGLSLREAETKALAVREVYEGSGIFPGFGVHFDSNTPRAYILFADFPEGPNLPGDGIYDPAFDQEVDHFFIEKSPQFSLMCTRYESEKYTTGGDCDVDSIDIVYLRPEPTITIMSKGVTHPDFTLFISTPNGATKTITVWFTGQIEISGQ